MASGKDESSSVATPLSKDGVICGTLYKRGEGMFFMRSWKKRFVVMDNGKLMYYDSEAQYDAGEANRTLPLDLKLYAVVASKTTDTEFSLMPISRTMKPGLVASKEGDDVPRSFEFRVEKPEERKGWMEALEKGGCENGEKFLRVRAIEEKGMLKAKESFRKAPPKKK